MLSDTTDQSVSAKSLSAGQRVGPHWIGGQSIEFRTLCSNPAAEDVTRSFMAPGLAILVRVPNKTVILLRPVVESVITSDTFAYAL
jgi:hypothetical protein